MTQRFSDSNRELDGDDAESISSVGASIASQRTRMFIDDLRSNLEALFTIQVAASYYMDNSFMLLLFRIFSQALLSRPEPEGAQNTIHAYFVHTFGLGLICMLLHVLFSPPSPGEATRGYMHGSLLLDFVGQSGPAWRSHLLLLDILILIVQLAYLDITRKRKALMASLQRRQSSNSRAEPLQAQSASLSEAQDLDSEEQGVLRYQHHARTAGLESDLMGANNSPRTRRSGSYQDITDRFHSGQGYLGTIWLFDLLKEKRQLTSDRPSYGPTTVLRSVVGVDLRQRRYSLIPFRS